MTAISKPEGWWCLVMNLLLAGHDADYNVPAVLVDDVDISAG